MSTTNCTDDSSGYLTRSGNDMKIVDRAVKKDLRKKTVYEGENTQ